MAQSNVKLTVDARGAISALNNTSLATNKLSAAAKGTTASLAGASTAAKGLGASLAATMGPIIALGAAFSTVNSALRAFSDRERDVSILRQGLKNLGEGTASLTKLQEAASKLGEQTLFNQEEFTRGFNLLTSFRKIGVDSYERVAQAAADVAQLNQVDVKTSFMQLAKALEDPERNLSALNRSGISFTKTQTEMIKTLMKANRTAEAHSMILDIVGNAYNKTAQAAAKGFAGQVDSLGEAWRDFGEALGKAVIPVLSPVVQGMTALLKFLNSSGGKAAAIIAGITLAVKGLSVALPLLQAQFIAIKVSAQIATGQLVATQATLAATSAGFATATAAANAFKLALAKTGIGLVVLALGFMTAKIIEASEEQKRFNQILEEGSAASITSEIEKLTGDLADLKAETQALPDAMPFKELTVEAYNKQIEETTEKINKLNKRLVIAQGIELWKEFEKTEKAIKDQNAELETSIERAKLGTEEERKAFDLKQKSVELIEEYGEKLAAPLIAILKENQEHKKTLELIKKKQTAAKKLDEQFKKVGETITESLADGIKGLIKGTQTLGEMLGNIANKVADILLDIGIKAGLSAIGLPVPGFAAGGRPPVGKPAIVGERGPELFIPDEAGTVIPNNISNKILKEAASNLKQNEAFQPANNIRNTGIRNEAFQPANNIKDTGIRSDMTANPILSSILKENTLTNKILRENTLTNTVLKESNPPKVEFSVPNFKENKQQESLKTNVVVNVDASGSSVEGDAGAAQELGSMLAAAIQAELVKEKRPGGLLA